MPNTRYQIVGNKGPICLIRSRKEPKKAGVRKVSSKKRSKKSQIRKLKKILRWKRTIPCLKMALMVNTKLFCLFKLFLVVSRPCSSFGSISESEFLDEELPVDLDSRENIRSLSLASGMPQAPGDGWRRLSALVKGETCKGTGTQVSEKSLGCSNLHLKRFYDR